MKTLITSLLFFFMLVLLSALIGFIWYLSDNGVPFKIQAQTSFIMKMFSILIISMGIIGPVLMGIFTGIKINDRLS